MDISKIHKRRELKRSDDERLGVMITADGIDYIEAITLSKQDKK